MSFVTILKALAGEVLLYLKTYLRSVNSIKVRHRYPQCQALEFYLPVWTTDEIRLGTLSGAIQLYVYRNAERISYQCVLDGHWQYFYLNQFSLFDAHDFQLIFYRLRHPTGHIHGTFFQNLIFHQSFFTQVHKYLHVLKCVN